MTFEEIAEKLKTHDLYMGKMKAVKVFKANRSFYDVEIDFEHGIGHVYTLDQFEKLLENESLKWVEKPAPDVMEEFGWEKNDYSKWHSKAGDMKINQWGNHASLETSSNLLHPSDHCLRLPTKENCVYAHENWELIQKIITELSQEVMPAGTIVQIIKPETK